MAAIKKKKDRATKDEMELLKAIIESNPILHQRVMHRLREQLALSRETIFDVVKKKTDSTKAKGRGET